MAVVVSAVVVVVDGGGGAAGVGGSGSQSSNATQSAGRLRLWLPETASLSSSSHAWQDHGRGQRGLAMVRE